MIEIWDYFMRRKSLLLAMLTVFVISGVLSYRALHSNAVEPTISYITVSDWGDDNIEVPHTGGENAGQPFFAVINPTQVATIAPRAEADENTSDDATFNIVEQPEDVVNLNSDDKVENNQAKHNLFHTTLLALGGILVLALGGYLTYWHFRR